MMNRRGLTIVELGLVIVVVIVVVVVAAVALGSLKARPTGNRGMRDSTHVRGIHQAMVMWAQNNADVFPLPSRIDLEDATVAEQGRAKDTTANIMSLLVFNGLFSPDLLISPQEANPAIKEYETYEYDSPRRAVRPAKALWDPGLSADFTTGRGHISYAHLLPAEHRLARWGNTFVTTEAAVGNRGPEITGAARQGDGSVVPTFANVKSYTFLMHGSKEHWNGNIAFNDNHVQYLTTLTAGTYRNAAGQETADLIHYDEPDDPSGLNHFLGIFISAGENRGEFQAIWD